MSSKWIIKPRDYELDLVKFQVKSSPIMRDQDPLNSDEIKVPVKKTKIKSNFK